MAIVAYIKTIWKDWLSRMTGPMSLVLVFVPIVFPIWTAKYLVGSALVWLIAGLCFVTSGYRAWRSEHLERQAAKLDPLIEDVGQMSQLWKEIQHDYRDRDEIRYPLSGFEAEKWEEIHKQLLRLYYRTAVHATNAKKAFNDLKIAEVPPLAYIFSDQNARKRLSGLDYTNLLSKHEEFLKRHRARIAG